MTPKVKYGLIAGGIGLVVNVCVSAFVGFCGPLVAILAGAGAGYFTARDENAMVQADGAKSGAISGAIAGGLVLVGQLIGGVVALAYFQSADITPFFGSLPDAGDAAGQTVFWLVGLGVGFCFGLVGVVLAAGGGAAAGYFGTSTGSSQVEI